MKKLLTLLIVAFVALGGLWACTNKSSDVPQENNTNTQEEIILLHKVDDPILLVELSKIDIENKTITLEDGTVATMLSDIDLSAQGAQTIKLRYVNADGKEVVEEKVIYINQKEELEVVANNQEKLQELLAAPTSVINPQEDDYVAEIPEDKPIENKGDTANSQGEVVENNVTEGQSEPAQESQVSSGGTNSSQASSEPTVTYTPTTNSQFPEAQEFVDWLNSTYGPQSCNTAASMWYNKMGGMSSNFKGYQTDSPQYGDSIIYYDANDGYMHRAIYLGNGMAMHGNYTSAGTATIAPVSLYDHYVFFRYDSNGNQRIDVHGHVIEGDEDQETIVEPSSNPDLWSSAEAEEEYWQAIDNMNQEDKDYNAQVREYAENYSVEELDNICGSQDDIWHPACQALLSVLD